MRTRRIVTSVLTGALVATTLAAWPSAAVAADPPATRSFHTEGNPILGDGSYYSADAAPLSVDGTLYVYGGHDPVVTVPGVDELPVVPRREADQGR